MVIYYFRNIRLKGRVGYPYLNQLIELWPGGWDGYLGMTNGVVFDRNKFELKSGEVFKERVLEMYWLNYFGSELQ